MASVMRTLTKLDLGDDPYNTLQQADTCMGVISVHDEECDWSVQKEKTANKVYSM